MLGYIMINSDENDFAFEVGILNLWYIIDTGHIASLILNINRLQGCILSDKTAGEELSCGDFQEFAVDENPGIPGT